MQSVQSVPSVQSVQSVQSVYSIQSIKLRQLLQSIQSRYLCGNRLNIWFSQWTDIFFHRLSRTIKHCSVNKSRCHICQSFLDALASLVSMLAVSDTTILFGQLVSDSYFFRFSVCTVSSVSTVFSVSTISSISTANTVTRSGGTALSSWVGDHFKTLSKSIMSVMSVCKTNKYQPVYKSRYYICKYVHCMHYVCKQYIYVNSYIIVFRCASISCFQVVSK